MTVAELIAQLEDLDPSLPVLICYGDEATDLLDLHEETVTKDLAEDCVWEVDGTGDFTLDAVVLK